MATGNLTEIVGFTTYTSGTNGFRDLGGASLESAVAVPEINLGSFGSVIALLLGALGLIERRSLRRLADSV